MIYSRPRFALLYLTASYLWLLITRSSALPCDNDPAEMVPPGGNDWTLVSTDCGTETKTLSVGDADFGDTLTASLDIAVPGITFQPNSITLECDATQLTPGQSSYTLDVRVVDTCPTAITFQIRVTFTDITASTNVNDPVLTPLAYNVVRDFYETDGGFAVVDVTTLTGIDADGDDVASVTITAINPASAPFSIVPAGTTSQFTLRLTGSLLSLASPVWLTLDVVDSGTPARTAVVTLTLTIDERPFFTSPAVGDTLYFSEDFSAGDAIHNLTYRDDDSSSASITFSVPNYDVTLVPFEVDAATAELRVAFGVTDGTFDVDAITSPLTYSVQLRVSDGTYESTITVTLVVDDVNDIVPVLSPSPIPDQNVVQSLPAESTILEFTTSDGDRDAPNNVVTLSLAGTNNDHFYFEGNFLKLATPSALNYSLVSEYNLVVTAADGADPGDTLNVTEAIRIVVQTEPVVVNIPTIPTIVPEDTAAGQAVYMFTSTDDDNADVTTLIYSITNQAPATPLPFEFVGAELRTVASLTADILDSEATLAVTSYTLDVTVSDGAYSDSTTLTITITDVNDVDPVFDANSYTAAIHEDTAAGTSVFDVGATDGDATAANNVITYSIAGINSDHFIIDGSTGLVTVALSSVLNATAVLTYTLDIVATDSGVTARSTTVPATITIEASPVIVNIPTIPTLVPEDTGAGQAVYTFTSTDEDNTDLTTLTYSITIQVPATPVPFEFVGAELRRVVGLTADVLDSEATGVVTSYTLDVEVSDGTYSDSTTLTITITDVNDVDPVFDANSYAAAIHEDTAAGTTVLDVGATDGDATAANNVITYSIAGTNSDHFVIDGSTGLVTVASPSLLDCATVSSYTLDIVATDSGATARSATALATITIEASPAFVAPAANEIPTEVAEDTAAETAVYTFISTDADTPQVNLMYTMGTQVPATPAPFVILGNQLKTVVGLTADVLDSEATGVVTSYTLDVEVSDGTYSDSTTLTITVTDVNDVDPVFDANSYAAAIHEDTAAGTSVLDVGATDGDATAANNVITYSIAGTNSVHFVIDGSTGLVTVASPSLLDYATVSSYTLDIVATDSGATARSATALATITIEASPVFVKPAAGEIPTEVAENTAAETAVYTFSSNDPDTLEASLVFTMDSQVPSTPAPFEIVGNQLKTVVGLTPGVLDSEATGAVTSYTISVTVDDGQYTDTATLTLTITDVNDVDPVFDDNSYTAAIHEDTAAGTTVFDVGATDADATAANNVITYSIAGTNSDHFVIDGSTGLVTVASPSLLDYAAVPLYTLDIVATDSGTTARNATVPATITIHASFACPGETYNGVYWGITRAGEQAMVACDIDPEQGYRRSCNFVGEWDQAVFGTCIPLNLTESIDNLATIISNITDNTTGPGQAEEILSTLGTIVKGLQDGNQTRPTNLSQPQSEIILHATNGLLGPLVVKRFVEDQDEEPSEQSAGHTILEVMDSLVGVVSDPVCQNLQPGDTQQSVKENVVVQFANDDDLIKFPTGSLEGVDAPRAKIELPRESLGSSAPTYVCRAGVYLPTVGDLLPPSDTVEGSTESTVYAVVNTPVISMTLDNIPADNLNIPVNITFGLNNNKLGKPVCVFYDFEAKKGRGDWSAVGCTVAFSSNETVVCQCNHLTNFAVLMSPTRIPLNLTESIDNLATIISNITDNTTGPGQAEEILSTLGTIVKGLQDGNQTRPTNLSQPQSEIILHATNGLLGPLVVKRFVEDQDEEPSEQSAGHTILEVMDSLVGVVSDPVCQNLQPGDTQQSVKENVVVQFANDDDLIKFPTGSLEGVDAPRAKIELPRESLGSSAPTYVCRAGVYLPTVGDLLPPSDTVEGSTESTVYAVVNTPVISMTLDNIPADNLNIPVNITFGLNNNKLGKPVCVFYDFEAKKGRGDWSAVGCTVAFSSNETVVCQCNHLTNFAVLMSPTRISGAHVKALSIISAVGCALSIFCLLLTMIIHWLVWKLVRSDRTVILMNLCCVLLVGLVVFLVGINRTESEPACKAIAAILQFLFLTVFFLMMLTGLKILICLDVVYTTKLRIKMLLPVSYFIPALIVAITLGVSKTEGFGTEEFCWLDIESGMIWAFIGPVLFVIVVNFIVIFIVLRKMASTTLLKSKSAKSKLKTNLRSICVLLPIMGLTWVLGVISVNQDTPVMVYLFCIFNSLQGVSIFLMHCVFNRHIRDALKHRHRKRKSMHSLKSDLRKHSHSHSASQEPERRIRNSSLSESDDYNNRRNSTGLIIHGGHPGSLDRRDKKRQRR